MTYMYITPTHVFNLKAFVISMGLFINLKEFKILIQKPHQSVVLSNVNCRYFPKILKYKYPQQNNVSNIFVISLYMHILNV